MEQASILWRRVDTQGHDACRLEQMADGWRLSGAAVCVEDGTISSISYQVDHDINWITRSAAVSGWVGTKSIALTITHDGEGQWLFDGVRVPKMRGTLDVDLGLTPATNTTAIRRLKLDKGQSEEATAAWLDPSDWRLKPLDQIYTRRSPHGYAYASPDHGFSAELTVNDFGFVTDYPGIWLAE